MVRMVTRRSQQFSRFNQVMGSCRTCSRRASHSSSASGLDAFRDPQTVTTAILGLSFVYHTSIYPSNLPTDIHEICMCLQNPQQGCAIESAILNFGSHLVSSVDLRPQSKRLGCSLKLSWWQCSEP
jgi:hypothetical protein